MSTRIDLAWTGAMDNVGVTGYQVERCMGVGCTSFVLIAAPSLNSYSDTGLNSSTVYSYRVRATDAASNLSLYSNTATVTTLTMPIPPPAPGPVVGSAGCGSAPPTLAVGYVSVTVDGARRQYYFVPPTNYDRSRAYKLVFGFHGNGGRGEFVRTDLAMEANAADQAFYIYPDGQDVPGYGFGWDTFNSESQDVHLIDKIVTDLKAGWCINSTAIFANGFSWGGWMSNHMACARPNMFRGIISIAGGGPDQCTLSKPVAAMIIHGSVDAAENISSGIAARNKFVSNNQCAATTAPTSFKLCVSYNSCAAGQPVYWCEHRPADFQETGPGAGQHIVPEFIKRDGVWAFFNTLQ
jgi:poly(3-hydroxybutyrate) depolymerase